MQRRRKYSNEFKHEAVQLTNHPAVGKAQIARELGINPNMLGRWCREFQMGDNKAFPGKGHAHDEEVARLRRELSRVKKERDFLKKAAGYFAKEAS